MEALSYEIIILVSKLKIVDYVDPIVIPKKLGGMLIALLTPTLTHA